MHSANSHLLPPTMVSTKYRECIVAEEIPEKSAKGAFTPVVYVINYFSQLPYHAYIVPEN